MSRPILHTQRLAGLEVFSCLPEADPRPTPLLFVHGAFVGGWMWTDTFLPYFAAAGYPAYAVSLRGHGGSDGHEAIYWHAISDYVADVKTVCHWLEGQGRAPVLIGHSMGGFVVQKYLEQHSAPGAILLCSVPPQGLVASQFHMFFQKPELFFEINRIMEGDHSDPTVIREALFAGEISDATLDLFRQRMQAESHRAVWDMSMFNFPLLAAQSRPPMLVAGGEKDALIPPFLVQGTAQTYGLRDHIFRGVGHMLPHEKEWPHIAATLVDWLEEAI